MWRGTHKWQSAVGARLNLWLVEVDIDLGVSGRATAAIAGNDPVVSPAHRLLVNKLDGGIRTGL